MEGAGDLSLHSRCRVILMALARGTRNLMVVVVGAGFPMGSRAARRLSSRKQRESRC